VFYSRISYLIAGGYARLLLRQINGRKYYRSLAALLLGCSVAAASWLTFGGGPQRNGWASDETAISTSTAKDLQLLWKVKLPNEPKQLNALTTPVVINPVYTNKGAETYVVIGGSSDNLFVIDGDTGTVVWQKHFTNDAPPATGNAGTGSYFCPDSLNDTPLILHGKEGPSVYVISIDGKLHALNLVNGEDRFPPAQFVPPYSKNWSLNSFGTFIYTTTSQGCAHSKSGVWGIDISHPEKPVVSFAANAFGGGIWGRGGASIGTNGTIYAETGDGPFDAATGKYGDTLLALSPQDLKLVDFYTPSNANYLTRKDLDMGNITPVVFPYKGRELVVGSGKEGALFMLDAKSLGGETHRKPLFQGPLYANEAADIAGRGFWGAFATWEDPKGTRWIYAPAWGPAASKAPAFPVTNGPTPDGSVMAFQVQDKDGQPVLAPAWISHNMAVPEPPVIANGVVFSISSGEFIRQVKENGELYSAQERIEQTTGNATLYAFDAQTGKELFSSGKTMPSFTHLGGIAVSDGRVYAATHDSTLYAFGLKGE
jgi:outer membrane protein assembly factor BamB